MAGVKVHLFPSIPELHVETQLYTQRRRNSESPQNYKFTIGDVIEFLTTNSFVSIKGAYDSDSSAQADGVGNNEVYELTEDNIYGLPEGLLKRMKL